MSATLTVSSSPSSPVSIRKSAAYKYRQPLSLALILIGWAGAVLSAPLVHEGTPADHLYDAVGWLFLLSGMGIRYWSILHIAGCKSRAVVDTGPYAMCRNPLYVGTMLLIACEAAFLKSGWFLMCFLLVAALYVWGVVPAEERWLTARLGDDYVDYCRRVPRWRPRFSREVLRGTPLKDRRAMGTELKHIFWWFVLLPLIGELSCMLREAPWHLLGWF